MREPTWRRYARLMRPDLAGDVDAEMEFHIQVLADRYVARGHSPEEARHMAAREFGDRDRARRECIDIDDARRRRDARAEWFSTFRKDFRHGLRRLAKNPGFSIIAVLTLAIGVGPTVAIFTIINSVLLDPLPLAHPDQLVYVQESFPLPGGQVGFGSVSYPNYLDWKAQSKSLDLTVVSPGGSANFQGAGAPERLSVAGISANTFDVVGVKPVLGRNFLPSEESPGAPVVALLGDGFWHRRFNADRNILGKKILLDGTPVTVVGVMQPTTTFPNATVPIDVWVPMQLRVTPQLRGSHAFQVIGRLKPGATLESARVELRQIASRLTQEYPQFQEKRSVGLTMYEEVVVGRVRKQLFILFGAAALVLLIACANAASLLLARAATRQREVAVLAALGASRGRVVQQFLVESLILSVAGAIAGFALARLAVKAIIVGAGNSLPRNTQIHFDWRVVAFVGGTVLLTTFIFGLAPAFQAARANLQDVLRGSGNKGGTGGTARFRAALVVGQFALSLTLLAGAGLLLRTFAALLATPTGMATNNVLTLRIPFPLGSERYKTPDDALNRFYDPMLERVRALPGVKSAGMINLLPMQRYGANGNFQVLGINYGSISDQPFAEYRVVSPEYFRTLGISIRRGRDVSSADRTKTEQVVLVNDALVKKYFDGADPIGRSIIAGAPGPNNPPVTIVGVVASVRQATVDQDPLPEIYLPTGQASGSLADMTLVVRTNGEPTSMQKSIEGAIRGIDPAQPVFGVRTMDDVVRGSVADRRLYLGLLGTFAAVALALAIAGIYGVMSYSVSQRAREFGIRLALGSDTAAVKRLVLWEGIRLAFLGVAIGLPGAFLTTRLLGSVLYGVDAHDPVTFGAVALLLAAVSIAASYLPARRVAEVDPILAMRVD